MQRTQSKSIEFHIVLGNEWNEGINKKMIYLGALSVLVRIFPEILAETFQTNVLAKGIERKFFLKII